VVLINVLRSWIYLVCIRQKPVFVWLLLRSKRKWGLPRRAHPAAQDPDAPPSAQAKQLSMPP